MSRSSNLVSGMADTKASSAKPPAPNVSFLKQSNPEVFKTRPRPGGARRKVDCEVQAKENFPGLTDPNISKDYKISTALEDCMSLSSQEATVFNPIQDHRYVLGLVLSTIMALAAKPDSVQKSYLRWLKSYLVMVVDNFGIHPPNVQLMLNYLATMDLEEDPADKTVRTTTRVSLPQAVEPAEGAEEPPAEAPEAAEEPPAEEEAA